VESARSRILAKYMGTEKGPQKFADPSAFFKD
jgi:hypothetical protein